MIDGIINVYKERGYTSHDVVAKLRGILKQKKIGHTGTLDPDAEGVLPVCLGKATKVCDLLTDKSKEYQAVLLLGVSTDTQDITGTVLSKSEISCSEEEIRSCISEFVGEQMQIPPMYSALKVNGQKLYDLARQGIEIERKPRKIYINHIIIEKVNLPEVTIRVSCSKGTYIRTLCHDIGEKLGCGGCMKSLLRTKVGNFYLENSYKLEDIIQFRDNDQLSQVIQSPDSVFLHLPGVILSKEVLRMVENGNPVPESLMRSCTDLDGMFWDPSIHQDGMGLRFYDRKGSFLAIYEWNESRNSFRAKKMFL